MMSALMCPTKFAMVLLGVRGDDGVFRFPSERAHAPGILFEPSPIVPIYGQIEAFLRSTYRIAGSHPIDVKIGFSLALRQVHDGTDASLYLATTSAFPAAKSLSAIPFTPLPTLIRGMGKSPNRIAYLKAWQMLSGAASETTIAIEADDLRKILEDPKGD